MTGASFLCLNRLRIMRGGKAVYDQKFHEGVNIIRGENGSGKSTIADFIFFVLGGEFDDWKGAARLCDEVQAEVETSRGALTLRRDIASKLSQVKVYFGGFENADQHALDGWEPFPIRRQESRESISQVLFRSLLIPEAQSEGASNITIHQLMRLLYSDQRTPAPRLFRFESFDTANIRTAVGDLVCGISGYEIYEINLKLRELDKEFDEILRRLSSLIEGLPTEDQFSSPSILNTAIGNLQHEKTALEREIEAVDMSVDQGQTQAFLKERQSAHREILKERAKISDLEGRISTLKLELSDLGEFIGFLEENVKKVALAESMQKAVGGIEFSQCPACLSELGEAKDAHTCNVCGSSTDPNSDRSKYNHIRLDLEIQIRESNQLVGEKSTSLAKSEQVLRRQTTHYSQLLSEFAVRFDLSTSPRESYLAARNQRIGQINQEIVYLMRLMETVAEIQRLSDKKSELQGAISGLKDRKEGLERQTAKRRSVALTGVSDIAVSLLHADLDRQAEFKQAQAVELNFYDDAIFVDGKLNFAESSNVFLKNSAILALFLAAGRDPLFNHPRFLLLDNIEDKGMEVDRSHRFQRLIVERATEIELRSQVIFTTSMMNPELDLDDYVIGPRYTHEHKTLSIDGV